MADTPLPIARPGNHLRHRPPTRSSTRVDLTPMVDLGFLLITFFMLTTVLQTPQVMPVVFPEKELPNDPPAWSDRRVLTLLLGGQDKVYYYEGITDARLDSTNYAPEGLRRVVLDKKARVEKDFGAGQKTGQTSKTSRLAVLIKPTREARYKNIVDVFDEMKICGISHYILFDVSPQELAFLRNPAGGLHFNADAQIKAVTSPRQ